MSSPDRAPEEAREPLVTAADIYSYERAYNANRDFSRVICIRAGLEAVAPFIAARAEAALRKRLADEIAALPYLAEQRMVRDHIRALVNPPPEPPQRDEEVRAEPVRRD